MRTAYLFLLAIIYPFLSHAQEHPVPLFLNSDFEFLDYENKFTQWDYNQSLESRYEVLADSSNYYSGKKSIRIRSKNTATANSSYVVYQKIVLDSSDAGEIDISFKIKINNGARDAVGCYAARFDCPQSAPHINSYRIDVDTTGFSEKPLKNKWLSYTYRIKLDKLDFCTEFYFGLVLKGKADLNIDDLMFCRNKVRNIDPRPTLPDLPREKDVLMLNNYIVGFSFSEDEHYFSLLDETIGDADVVALGEATHGTHEFSLLHYQIIKYLVEQKGFEVLALESNMPYTQGINDALQENRPSSDIANEYFYNIHRNTEMVNLLDYVRKYNKKTNNKLYIEGFDSQYSAGAVAQLRKTFPLVDTIVTEWKKGIRRRGDQLRANFEAAKISLDSLCDFLLRRCTRELRLEEEANGKSLVRMQQDISVLKDALYLELIEPLSFNVYKRLSSSRDSMMAKNVTWLRRFYKGKKIILIAHNAHVTKERNNIYEVFNGILYPMGHYLNVTMKEKYKSLGLTTASGSATFFTPNGTPEVYPLSAPAKNTVEFYFSLLKFNNFI